MTDTAQKALRETAAQLRVEASILDKRAANLREHADSLDTLSDS